jgi:hypothetical protein
MKLNLGCGSRRWDGYWNVDVSDACAPDEVWDLETTPWPWPDSSAEHIVLNHVLEHLGQTPAVFLAVMAELYRVAAPGADIAINVPHPRHDDFLSDPTHVRPITPATLKLFDRTLNLAWKEGGYANTPLALYTGVDFFLKSQATILESDVFEAMQSGKLTQEQVGEMVKRQANVAKEYRFVLTARKD